MKKLFLGAALLSIAMSCPAETKQALTLHMTTGAAVVYFLDTEPSIGFEGQNMVVTVQDESTPIPMQNVDHWEIGMAEHSSVGALRSDASDVTIRVDGSTLSVNGAADGTCWSVYSVSGVAVKTGCSGDEAVTLAPGVYIVTVANNSYKIAIR